MQKEQHDRLYSYKDIQHWEGNWELIDGVPYEEQHIQKQRAAL